MKNLFKCVVLLSLPLVFFACKDGKEKDPPTPKDYFSESMGNYEVSMDIKTLTPLGMVDLMTMPPMKLTAKKSGNGKDLNFTDTTGVVILTGTDVKQSETGYSFTIGKQTYHMMGVNFLVEGYLNAELDKTKYHGVYLGSSSKFKFALQSPLDSVSSVVVFCEGIKK